MSYLLEVRKSGTAETLPPLSAAEALHLWDDAEAHGLTVQCHHEAGGLVTKEQLQEAAGRT